jgi:hypothetical protein
MLVVGLAGARVSVVAAPAKVTLYHKGKNTLTVAEPAAAARGSLSLSKGASRDTGEPKGESVEVTGVR